MNLKYAYETGFVTGYNIAVQNRGDYNLADEDERERFISEMCEHESDVYRQFSPFEFTAKEFNASRNPDKTWERYDKGVYDGICKLVKEEVALIKNSHE